MLYKGLPLYKIVISSEDDYTEDDSLGMETISIVDCPAVEVDVQKFEKEEEIKKNNFSIDEEEGIIFGVAIRCGMPIYRRGGISGGDYYVVFQKDQIQKIVERYSQKQRWNNVSLQHNGENIKDVVMVSMFLKDTEKGINPKGFEDVEEYSLFVGFKVLDNDLWTKLRTSKDFNGFSIEIVSTLEPITNDPTEFEKETHEEKDELETFIDNIFSEEDKKKSEEFVSEDEIEKINKGSNKVNITIDGETKLAQIDDVYKFNGFKYVAYYVWDEVDNPNGKWQFSPIDDVEKITKTDIPKDNLKQLKEKPSWKGIEEIIDDTTEKRIDRNDFEKLIDSGMWCTINYFNPPDGGYTTARQAVLLAYGETIRNNPCLRIYEKFGTSKSVAEGEKGAVIPYYRLLRIDRIINLRPIDYMEECSDDEVDSWGKYNWNGDRGMLKVYHHRKRGVVKER